MTRYESAFQGFLQFKRYRRSWSFPVEVERLIMDETVALGKSTLHLYGGLARFGTRMDIDPATSPDIIGNALYPPFRCKSWDVVIVDPPYTALPGSMVFQIIGPAACLARERVWWVHSHWSVTSSLGLSLRRWWLGSPCSKGSLVRVIAEYSVTGHPGYCHAVPGRQRRKLRPEFKRYDWTKYVPTPPRQGRCAVQGRLL
jgi:hypothetical protein